MAGLTPPARLQHGPCSLTPLRFNRSHQAGPNHDKPEPAGDVIMKAADVMVTDVITLRPDDTVQHAASVLLDRGISAAPVVAADGKLDGLVSEGDLVRRAEIGTARRRSWWLELLTTPEARAQDYVRSHAVKVADVMTTDVVTATEGSSLADIVTLLEKNGIKRVPVVRDGKVVGIVSRRNIVQAFARTAAAKAPAAQASDDEIRDRVMQQVRAMGWAKPWLLNVTVSNGVVQLWGPVDTQQERQGLRVAAESTPGVTAVEDNLYHIPITSGA
jgi:CBS domain-containing protein